MMWVTCPRRGKACLQRPERRCWLCYFIIDTVFKLGNTCVGGRSCLARWGGSCLKALLSFLSGWEGKGLSQMLQQQPLQSRYQWGAAEKALTTSLHGEAGARTSLLVVALLLLTTQQLPACVTWDAALIPLLVTRVWEVLCSLPHQWPSLHPRHCGWWYNTRQ